MSFTITYGGESTHLLEGMMSGLDDGNEWFMEIGYWATDSSADGGHHETLIGRFGGVNIHNRQMGSTVTILPSDADGEPIEGADPVVLRIDNITSIVIP